MLAKRKNNLLPNMIRNFSPKKKEKRKEDHMRVKNNSTSFLNKVRKFLPNMKEKRKKAHIGDKEQENFLETKKAEVEKNLDNAQYVQRVSAEIARALSSQIRELEKPVGYETFGLREYLLFRRRRYLAKIKKTLDFATATIERLEKSKKEIEDDPHKFLRKIGRL